MTVAVLGADPSADALGRGAATHLWGNVKVELVRELETGSRRPRAAVSGKMSCGGFSVIG